MYELVIIGGGPAGVSAGVYAARKKIKTFFVTKDFLSQSTVSENIQNWIGTPSISGSQLAKDLESHLRAYADDVIEIKTGSLVNSISKIDSGFEVILSTGEKIQSKTVLVTTGSNRRKLNIKGADTFEHKGLTYCATCDAPMFGGMDVAVIGGGNAGFESASQLLVYAKSVTLLHKRETFKADQITVDAVSSHANFKALTNVTPTEVLGEQFVNGLTYKNLKTNEESTLSVSGIFVEIGAIPTTQFVQDLVSLDETKHIVIDPWNHRTSQEGVWAAGDCTNGHYHQNNIAAGDAIKALEDIYIYLQKTKHHE
jgi:NADH-dependent peroxiredoxin subunit F